MGNEDILRCVLDDVYSTALASNLQSVACNTSDWRYGLLLVARAVWTRHFTTTRVTVRTRKHEPRFRRKEVTLRSLQFAHEGWTREQSAVPPLNN
eukprot:4833791-Pleurochrysis_carterae.AAC.1